MKWFRVSRNVPANTLGMAALLLLEILENFTIHHNLPHWLYFGRTICHGGLLNSICCQPAACCDRSHNLKSHLPHTLAHRFASVAPEPMPGLIAPPVTFWPPPKLCTSARARPPAVGSRTELRLMRHPVVSAAPPAAAAAAAGTESERGDCSGLGAVE
jgi:hypothetical protein